MNKEIHEGNEQSRELEDLGETDPKSTIEWVVDALVKVGAGYLAKVILNALGY